MDGSIELATICSTAPLFRCHVKHWISWKHPENDHVERDCLQLCKLWNIAHRCDEVRKEPLYFHNSFSPFFTSRCSFPQELPAGVQEDPKPTLQGVRSCLHPPLWQCLQYGCRGPHQYLLQTLLLLHFRVQPDWTLWAGAPGETLAWPHMRGGEGGKQGRED